MQQITITQNIVLENNESAEVKIDPLRMEQVITNIIENAAKYSPGKKKIIVNSSVKNGAGIGIPPQNLHKIFNRFYRVEEVSKYFAGFGIGLFISSEIVRQHDGSIWAESRLGEGSTFYISLALSA